MTSLTAFVILAAGRSTSFTSRVWSGSAGLVSLEFLASLGTVAVAKQWLRQYSAWRVAPDAPQSVLAEYSLGLKRRLRKLDPP